MARLGRSYPARPLTRPTVPIAREQEGFRWRDDDGSEAAATWLDAQDANITRAKETTTRLRILTNTGADMPSEALTLQYHLVGSDQPWKDVPL